MKNVYWLTDDTLDVGKEPMEKTEFEKKWGKLKILTKEELKEYGIE